MSAPKKRGRPKGSKNKPKSDRLDGILQKELALLDRDIASLQGRKARLKILQKNI